MLIYLYNYIVIYLYTTNQAKRSINNTQIENRLNFNRNQPEKTKKISSISEYSSNKKTLKTNLNANTNKKIWMN